MGSTFCSGSRTYGEDSLKLNSNVYLFCLVTIPKCEASTNDIGNKAAVAQLLGSRTRDRRVMSSCPSVTKDPPCREADVSEICRRSKS
ncbi:hypothetical protein TNCV_4678781 [Trichonephila clavipes]|nr:hypothetical protein TNCV_4678781 [Trichonephila clavipes]